MKILKEKKELNLDVENKGSEKPTRKSAKTQAIDDDEYIAVASYFDGNLKLFVQDMPDFIQFNKFGEVQYLRFKFLKNLATRYRNLFESPYVYILDEEAVESLMLTETYEDLIQPSNLADIFNQPKEDVMKFVREAEGKLQNTLRRIAINLVKNDKISDYKLITALKEELNFYLSDDL